MNPTKTANVFHHSPVIQHRLILWVAEPKTLFCPFLEGDLNASLLRQLCRLIWDIGIVVSIWSQFPFAQFHWTLTVSPSVNTPLSFGGCLFWPLRALLLFHKVRFAAVLPVHHCLASLFSQPSGYLLIVSNTGFNFPGEQIILEVVLHPKNTFICLYISQNGMSALAAFSQ